MKHHLVARVPVADLCDSFGLHPTVFWRWQKEYIDNGANACDADGDTGRAKLERRIDELEQQFAKKHEVLSEPMEEHVPLNEGAVSKAGTNPVQIPDSCFRAVPWRIYKPHRYGILPQLTVSA